MSTADFNPVGFLVNLAIGWCFLSLAHASVRSWLAGDWGGIAARFASIALARDGTAAFLNLAIAAGIGLPAAALWLAFRR